MTMSITTENITIINVRGHSLRRSEEIGPKGGKKIRYQSALASPVWGYWYVTAAQAIRESGPSDRVVCI